MNNNIVILLCPKCKRAVNKSALWDVKSKDAACLSVVDTMRCSHCGIKFDYCIDITTIIRED